MKKAIATIIAVILLLLLVVALAGSAWFYIYGYWKKGVVSQNIETGGAFCGEGFAAVPIKNIGADPINISATKIQTEEYQPTINTVGLWHFNEGSDNITYDSSGNGNHGTLYNGSEICSGGYCPTWVEGKFGKALRFDGVDDYIDCKNDSSLSITDNITIEAWIKPIGEPSNEGGWGGGIVSKHNGTDGYALYFGAGNHRIRWRIGTDAFSSNTVLVFGNWYHVVGVYNGTNMTLYINGNLDNSIGRSGPIPTNSWDVLIGESLGGYKGTRTFNGTIEEVRIYNRSMTKEEIKSQHEWNYVCSGSGDKYTCGDLTITKNSGGSLDPYFDKGVFGGYESALLKDRNCNGNCEYYIVTKSGRASKVQLFDC